MTIHNLIPTNSPLQELPKKTLVQPGAETPGFSEMLGQVIGSVDASQKAAQRQVGEMAAGATPIDQAMIALEKADLEFRLVTQVRNKVVEAYREVMRMTF